jgi:hypothetical protein
LACVEGQLGKLMRWPGALVTVQTRRAYLNFVHTRIFQLEHLALSTATRSYDDHSDIEALPKTEKKIIRVIRYIWDPPTHFSESSTEAKEHIDSARS